MMQHTSYRWMKPLSLCAHVKLHVGVKRPCRPLIFVLYVLLTMKDTDKK